MSKYEPGKEYKNQIAEEDELKKGSNLEASEDGKKKKKRKKRKKKPKV